MKSALANFSVPYVNLALQYDKIKEELLRAVEYTLRQGQYILGSEVREFEEEFAEYCGVRYAVGVGSGTDALVLALKASGIGPGDEVVTVPNSFLASTSSIVLAGATPAFVDVREDYNIDPDLIEAVITSRTRAILPVHLTGRPADMSSILAKADKYNLAVIEDAAQAVGAGYHKQRVGSFGVTGCFSFHPLKNLNACGDAGAITTNDEIIYRYLLKARNHGLCSHNECEFWSLNSRLDALQAAMLRVKLKCLDTWTRERRAIARFYQEHLSDIVEVPQENSYEYNVYQTFIIQSDQRDELQIYLKKRGVETKIHYPVPIHLQKAARTLGFKTGDFPEAERQARRILSLPIYPELSQEQIRHVVSSVQEFFVAQNIRKLEASI